MSASRERHGLAGNTLGPWLLILLVAGGTLAGSAIGRAPETIDPGAGQSIELAAVLSGDSAGFAVADRVRAFEFPRDHGPHPDFRSEWWYFTGNLQSDGGRRFGFQLTFFRFALSAGDDRPAPSSAWSTRQVYMAHFALTDVAGRRFQAFEKFEREALALAGAVERPFRVWLGPWEARAEGPDFLPMRLRAAQGDTAIDLRIEAGKPRVLQGNQGLSQKSGRPGNASYYYSYTRLPARGRVRVDGSTYPVAGAVWMDREWSTSALDPDQPGWDWFGLQLDDGREIMFYRLRRKGGETDPHSAGSLVELNGEAHALGAGDVVLRATRQWQSPRGGSYPVGWRVRIPRHAVDVQVSPVLADQEHSATLRYWEGAVDVRGTSAGRAVSGRGYLELTGYASPGR